MRATGLSFLLLSLAASVQAFVIIATNHDLSSSWSSLRSTSSSDEIVSALDQLLDRTVLLYSQSKQQQWKSTATFLTDQLSSLAVFLSTQRQAALEDNDESFSSSEQLAQEIQDAMLQAAPLATVEALIEEFRRASQQSSSTSAFWMTTDQVKTIQQQLDAFQQLVEIMMMIPALPVVEHPENKMTTPTAKSFSTTTTTTTTTTSTTSTQLWAMKSSPLQYQAANDVRHHEVVVDVAIVGAGVAGLCAGAILNTCYGKKVGIYESHYLAGGCAHAFDRSSSSSQNDHNKMTFTFDAGPTILLGCSDNSNALQQVLRAVNQTVNWIPYDGWGMIESPGTPQQRQWRVELGHKGSFLAENGPLQTFGGGPAVLEEFRQLQKATGGLLVGAQIPAMAMRAGPTAVIPLALRYFGSLVELIRQGDAVTGTFGPFMNGPAFTVRNPWLRNWLDALAFSLSGLPACRTAAAAMAFVLQAMHRPNATLDYPAGGMGAVVDALVRGVEQGDNGSKVHVRARVDSIDCDEDAMKMTGVTLADGTRVRAREGVICNAPVWSLEKLIQDERVLRKLNNNRPVVRDSDDNPPSSWTTTKQGSYIQFDRSVDETTTAGERSLLSKCNKSEKTGSFLHLHIAIDSRGLDLSKMEAHYTVMDRSLAGDGSLKNGVPDGPCGELNMIALSNPCVIDPTLAPKGFMVLHAYGAANEPYEIWEGMDRRSPEYAKLKEERAKPLWRAVESIIPDVRDRVVLEMIGSPLTHEFWLRRDRGTYGSATEDYLKDGSTPLDTLVIANDGVFPGIGIPSVAIAGASAANKFVSVIDHWKCLDRLQRESKM